MNFFPIPTGEDEEVGKRLLIKIALFLAAFLLVVLHLHSHSFCFGRC